MPKPQKLTEPTTNAPIATATQVPTPARISVLDRRMNDPFGTPSRPVPLRGDKVGWVVREFTRSPERPSRHYQAVFDLGWMPLTTADIAVDPHSLGYDILPDHRIAKGTHGETILMAMPAADYDKLVWAKERINSQRLKKETTRDTLAQETATVHGAEAGDFAYKHFEQREVIGPKDAA